MTTAVHAAPGADAETPAPTVLTFGLAGHVCAVDVHRVREILDPTEITPLPDSPHDVLGMIDLRGQCIAVIDVAGRIGAAGADTSAGRIVVFDLPRGDGTVPVAVPADRVLGVLELCPGAREPLPDTMTDWRCAVATGMVRTEHGIAVILDTDALFGGGLPGPFDFG